MEKLGISRTQWQTGFIEGYFCFCPIFASRGCKKSHSTSPCGKDGRNNPNERSMFISLSSISLIFPEGCGVSKKWYDHDVFYKSAHYERGRKETSGGGCSLWRTDLGRKRVPELLPQGFGSRSRAACLHHRDLRSWLLLFKRLKIHETGHEVYENVVMKE